MNRIDVKKRVWDHFVDVALNVEYYNKKYKNEATRIKKWNRKNIDVYLCGDFKNDLAYIQSIFNRISKYTKLKYNIITSERCDVYGENIIIYIGTYDIFSKHISINKEERYNDVYGLCEVSVDDYNEIKSARIFIKYDLDKKIKNDVILEEITQSIGLMNDSTSRKNSVFYKNKKTKLYNSEYSDEDVDIIRLLYNNRIQPNNTKRYLHDNIINII
tara:strand:+ start:298 stop:945 length:648 start_codon:yes stop_codon:yes gene_type:complete